MVSHTHTYKLHPNREKKKKGKQQRNKKKTTKNPFASHSTFWHSCSFCCFHFFCLDFGVGLARYFFSFILISCCKCITTPRDQRIGNEDKKPNQTYFHESFRYVWQVCVSEFVIQQSQQRTLFLTLGESHSNAETNQQKPPLMKKQRNRRQFTTIKCKMLNDIFVL